MSSSETAPGKYAGFDGKPRHGEMALIGGSLPENISDYSLELIQEQGGWNGSIGRQYIAQPELERNELISVLGDPLHEDEHEVAPGLVYKYKATYNEDGSVKRYGRALFTITRICAMYCRFCTRGREVGVPKGKEAVSGGALALTPTLSREQIDESLAFIQNEKDLNEVIVSGGDPLTVRSDVFAYITDRLAEMQDGGNGKLEIVRIGTRLPVHDPGLVRESHYDAVEKLFNPNIMIHINTSDEVTPQMVATANEFRKRGATVYSQSVLLNGVNGTLDDLKNLFRKVKKNGIVPYYIFQNDPVPWATHFTMPFREGYEMWKQVRADLSGIVATCRYVIDAPDGSGKVVVPEGAGWEFDINKYYDFEGVEHVIV